MLKRTLIENEAFLLGLVAQLLACPTADQGVTSLISAPSHTLVETDDEIISTIIHCQLQAKDMCTQYWLTA